MTGKARGKEEEELKEENNLFIGASSEIDSQYTINKAIGLHRQCRLITGFNAQDECVRACVRACTCACVCMCARAGACTCVRVFVCMYTCVRVGDLSVRVRV